MIIIRSCTSSELHSIFTHQTIRFLWLKKDIFMFCAYFGRFDFPSHLCASFWYRDSCEDIQILVAEWKRQTFLFAFCIEHSNYALELSPNNTIFHEQLSRFSANTRDARSHHITDLFVICFARSFSISFHICEKVSALVAFFGKQPHKSNSPSRARQLSLSSIRISMM